MYEIYTYATHSQGEFENLVNNKFNVKINVVGMGEKWISFVESKIVRIKEELEKLDPELVVIFLDGFDTIINKHPDIAYDYYINNSPDKILISQECDHGNNFWCDLFLKKVFLSWRPVNSGMIIGKVKYLLHFYEKVIEYFKRHNETDDQRIFNIYSYYLNVDKENKIFHNLNYVEREKCFSNFEAVFLQTPGVLTWDRFYRVITDYVPFFIEEIMLVIVLIVLILTIVGHLTTSL